MRKKKGYWTKETCQEESLKYENRTDFRKKSRGAYNKTYENKWLNDICSHMKKTQNK